MEDAGKQKEFKQFQAYVCGTDSVAGQSAKDITQDKNQCGTAEQDIVMQCHSQREQPLNPLIESKDEKWKKVVYGGMQKNFPDNHTDSSFLEAMVMNANVVKRDIWTTIRDSVAISQYVSVVAMVSAMWTYTLKSPMDPIAFLLLDVLLLSLGFVIILLTSNSISFASLSRSTLHIVYFVCGLHLMAPIFQTLTRSISSDSIWACTICLLLVHLFFHDYTYSSISFSHDIKYSRGLSPSFLANISLHASIVASVLIASRLPSRLLVFALMFFSLEFFLLFPLLSYWIQKWSMTFHLVFSFVVIGASMGLIFPLSQIVFYLYLLIILSITIICPIVLIKIQEYKFEINGPWDEAKLCFDID